MDPTETIPIPVLGEQGEPCEGCGSPLAADQRYCLNCGQRRAGPRVEYRQHLSAADGGNGAPVEPPQAAAKAATPEPQKRERDYAPLAAVGGIAVLGLMLLVGVLIGKGNNTTATAPPTIVKYSGGAPGAGGIASAAPEDAKPKAAKKASGGSTKTGATKVKGGLTGSAARSSAQPVEASTNDLENLNSQSGEEYEKSIEKLPDKIATPGKAPPIDTSKAPGGGGAAESIE
jgi:hypothetical protein